MAVAARKAQFAPDPQRRALLAKVHIAPKQLAMDEDSYRAVLLRETGHTSASKCSVQQLQALIAEFTRLGFKAAATVRKPGQPMRADHPMARKARAMWISLGYLCAIDDPSEKALERFAKRQLGCDTLQFARQSDGDRLIEALKAIAQRHGWCQSVAGFSKDRHVAILKVSLSNAILRKMKRIGMVPADWHLGIAAFRLTGMDVATRATFTAEEHDKINQALGAKLRTLGDRAVFQDVEVQA